MRVDMCMDVCVNVDAGVGIDGDMSEYVIVD